MDASNSACPLISPPSLPPAPLNTCSSVTVKRPSTLPVGLVCGSGTYPLSFCPFVFLCPILRTLHPKCYSSLCCHQSCSWSHHLHPSHPPNLSERSFLLASPSYFKLLLVSAFFLDFRVKIKILNSSCAGLCPPFQLPFSMFLFFSVPATWISQILRRATSGPWAFGHAWEIRLSFLLPSHPH